MAGVTGADRRSASATWPRARLAWWNDEPERTQEEVLALLDRVIAKEEGKRGS